jgi:phage tail protein X
MPTHSSIKVTEPGSGKSVANVEVNGRHRQVVCPADPDTEGAIAKVANANPGLSDYGIIVREAVSSVTPLAPDSHSVTDSNTEAVPANATRRGLAITNIGTTIVYLAFGAHAAVAGKGIALYPNGGSWNMSDRALTTLAVNAIVATGSGSLSIQEF